MKHSYTKSILQIVAPLIGLCLLTGASAQTPVRLTANGLSGSDPKAFAPYAGRLYFSAKTSTDGPEVYATNGTTAGTNLLKNINTGAGLGADPAEFTEYNGKLYFSAATPSNGRELWVSDGTAGGTVLFKDIYPGSSAGNPTELTPCNGRLYFVAQNGPQRELWVSDGTAGGTQRLSDALGVPTGGANPSQLTCSGDKLFYVFAFRNDLWFTNGTAGNTRFVKGGPLVPANPDGPRLFISLSQLTALDGKLIFRGNSPGTEDEPWVSDGTPDGTFTLDAMPGVMGSFPTDFYAFNGRVYFNASILNSFWSTNGTIAGTQRIKSSFTAKEPTGFNGNLYFFFGSQLWVTNGTEAGTLRVKDLAGGPGTNTPRELTVVGDRLYFVVKPTTSLTAGGQLWISDGTEAGTTPVYTINHPSGFVGQSIRELIPYNDQLLFTAATEFGASTPPTPELWRLDYTNLPPVAPVAGIPNVSGTAGVSFFQVIPSFTDPEGFPMTYTVTGLPANLAFSGGSGGIVAGVPIVPGVFPITVTARDLGGLATSVTYTLTINASGSSTLQLLTPTYNCASGAITLNTSGGNGSPVLFSVPGVQRGNLFAISGFVEDGLRNDPKPIMIQATQSGTTVNFLFNLPGACGGSPSPGTPFQLLAPAYNCATGAINFQTSGGNGSLIEYAAAGITGWTTNPSQFVDQDSRTANDVQPFMLMARQNGVTVTYVWNLKAACGRARQGVDLPETTLLVTVLANPATTGTATVEIRGAAGQPLRWTLTDGRGRSVSEERIEQAGPLEKRTVRLNQEPGLYFLRVSTPDQVSTVKILRQ